MRPKMTITLSMLWIGTMALLSTPAWWRGARDFVLTRSGAPAAAQPKAQGGGSGGGRK